jgi:N-methylhydantoinase A/oxoprolinase/acetone carboxylase beta subunit
VIQYDYFMPKIDIEAIGAGGGSLARVDPFSRGLRWNPRARAPTPAPLLRRGNTTPTVTDADVVLGYIDPENFLGGRIEFGPRQVGGRGAGGGRRPGDVADGSGQRRLPRSPNSRWPTSSAR